MAQVAGEPSVSDPAGPPAPPGRRDAVRNYHRVLEAAREVLGESGADASMEEIAARAGVGVGTVYRRFANKDALIDELVRLSLCEALAEARQALACPGGDGLEQFLRGLGALFAAHAKYAHLLLERSADGAAAREIRAAVQELTSRALAAGTLNPDVTVGDVMALVWAHARADRDNRRGRAGHLAAVPRHPPGGPAHTGPAQRQTIDVGRAAGGTASRPTGSRYR